MDEIKYFMVIEALNHLGYTHDQILYGINNLDINKYLNFNTDLVLQDIINKIEQGDKE